MNTASNPNTALPVRAAPVAPAMLAPTPKDCVTTRAANADLAAFDHLMARSGGEKPRAGDERAAP